MSDLLERLEMAAQACHAAMILSCESTCRDAVEEIKRLRLLERSRALELEDVVRFAIDGIKKCDVMQKESVIKLLTAALAERKSPGS